jgi:hypothetical protein
MTNEELTGELVQIGEDHGGFVRPSDVVRAARLPRSPLHEFFEWDDSKAATGFRLEQARHLIRRVTVILTYGDEPISVRAFVSLVGDRGEGSYRSTVTVLGARETREQLLEEALAEMEAFQRKYRHLTEVAEVVRAMARTSKRLRANVPAESVGREAQA